MRHTQLRSFHAVARTGSFTGAARSLHVSQPTVTTQVKSLEREFGVELFVRRGRRIELSDVGRGLRDITLRLFSHEAEAVDFLNESRELKSGHLRVGAVGPYHVTDMLAAFNARHPGIYVSVAINNSREVLRDLLEYRTDVAVLAHIDPDERLVAIPYRRHRVVVFVHDRHRLFTRRSVRLEEVAGERMILREGGSTTRRAFEDALRTAGIAPKIVMEIGSREAIREAVAKGIGIGVVSEAEYIPDQRLKALQVTNADIYTYAHVVYLRERQEARLVRAFRAILPELLAGDSERKTSRAKRGKNMSARPLSR